MVLKKDKLHLFFFSCIKASTKYIVTWSSDCSNKKQSLTRTNREIVSAHAVITQTQIHLSYICIHVVFKECITVLTGHFQGYKVTSAICVDLLQVFSTPVCNQSHTHVNAMMDQFTLLDRICWTWKC